MKTHLWDDLIKIIKKEVVPALGCTEPVSVALAAAIATGKLSGQPKHIAAFGSRNPTPSMQGLIIDKDVELASSFIGR